MKSPRISHTHLQYAPADTKQKIAKEYVLPALQTKQKRKHIPPTMCIVHSTLRDATTPYTER
jgi:hypothetical protein